MEEIMEKTRNQMGKKQAEREKGKEKHS